jgi:hypothetical protein
MNVHAPPPDGLAVLKYGTPDFDVIKPGAYVLCAVTGRRIPLEALRYWSVELQEAYLGPEEATSRIVPVPGG